MTREQAQAIMNNWNQCGVIPDDAEEREVLSTLYQPVVIAIDDWMIWARDAQGRIVETCCEMWLEWLDFARDPSDMETDEYRAAVISILRAKRPTWRDTQTATDDSTRRYAVMHGHDADPQTLSDEWRWVREEIEALACEQAAFIAALRK